MELYRGLVLLHGEGGFLDELVIVVVAFGVMWLAVRLAGRQPVGTDDDANTPGDAPAEEPKPTVAERP